MKKFIFLVMAALLLGSTVTGCKGKTEQEKINDSIAQLMGKMEGVKIKTDFQDNPKMSQLDKDQYIRGIMSVVKLDTTNNNLSYIEGIERGIKLYYQLYQLEERGISIDRKLYLNEFKKILDNKEPIDLKKYNEEEALLKDLTKRSLILKGKENLAAGKKYIEEQMKKDNGYKKHDSGIVYKIVEQGNGETFYDESVVDVKILLKDINNKVYINTTSEPMPASIGQMKQDPIFNKLYDIAKAMKPGSKVIAIIPGDQIPTEMMGLSPNLTLVCELTTVGLHKEEPRPAQSYPGRTVQNQPVPIQ